MRPDADPALMTTAERFRELAGILAAGVLRLRDRAALAADPGEHPTPENLSKTGDSCLELSGKTVLSVHGG
ncbi:MAG TPA: hypothetical protein VFA26_02910 [Gemmataceae bacterium]|nr:hypothetical protein [Gemmataceae bacterium]